MCFQSITFLKVELNNVLDYHLYLSLFLSFFLCTSFLIFLSLYLYLSSLYFIYLYVHFPNIFLVLIKSEAKSHFYLSSCYFHSLFSLSLVSLLLSLIVIVTAS